MKQLVLAIMMCIAAALGAKAQVLTSETVNHAYEAVINQTNSDYVFNAEWTGKDITTMYVYQETRNLKGLVTLKPYLKYDYSYAADGILTSKITYRWAESQDNWVCASRYDYTLTNGTYSAEYSRYNHIAKRFDQPVEKMVYLLDSETEKDLPILYAKK